MVFWPRSKDRTWSSDDKFAFTDFHFLFRLWPLVRKVSKQVRTYWLGIGCKSSSIRTSVRVRRESEMKRAISWLHPVANLLTFENESVDSATYEKTYSKQSSPHRYLSLSAFPVTALIAVLYALCFLLIVYDGPGNTVDCEETWNWSRNDCSLIQLTQRLRFGRGNQARQAITLKVQPTFLSLLEKWSFSAQVQQMNDLMEYQLKNTLTIPHCTSTERRGRFRFCRFPVGSNQCVCFAYLNMGKSDTPFKRHLIRPKSDITVVRSSKMQWPIPARPRQLYSSHHWQQFRAQSWPTAARSLTPALRSC